jgi:predicted transcriptional regulator of viral defense system
LRPTVSASGSPRIRRLRGGRTGTRADSCHRSSPNWPDDPTGPYACIAAAAAGRHGIVTTGELRSAGIGSATTTRWAQNGRLIRIATGVYRFPAARTTWEQTALGSVRAGPAGTVLSHRAAAALLGLRGFEPGTIELMSHRWHRARPPGVIVHESLALDPLADVIEIDAIPVTNAVRTIIDLGAVCHPLRVGRALDECRRRGELELTDVDRRLRQLAKQGRNGICAVRELIEVRQGKLLASTGFEDLLLGIVDDFGLPTPEMQYRVADGAFVAYLDFAYPAPRLAVEADSEEYHLDLAAFHHDRERQNRLVLLGWNVLRFTPTHLRRHRRSVAAQIASALALPFSHPESSASAP